MNFDPRVQITLFNYGLFFNLQALGLSDNI